MAGDAARRLMSVAEFLDWDDGTDTRYELWDGVPVAMAPASDAHGTLVMRLGARIDEVLRKRPPCRVVSEVGVVRPNRNFRYFIPDLAVTCQPHRHGTSYMDSPLLLVEVISPSNRAEEVSAKLADYRAIASVREIVLLSASHVRAEVLRRLDGPGAWLTELCVGAEAVLRLDSVGLALPLGELYRDLELAPPPGADLPPDGEG